MASWYSTDMRQTKRLLLAVPAVLLAAALLTYAFIRPSNARDWSPDQATEPTAVFSGSLVTIHGVRNAVYRSTTDYDVRLEDRTYDLSTASSAWYVVEPFGEREAAAHTFLTFGFDDGRYLGISIEIRKEKGESFSAGKGLLKNYELMYVVGDERDLIGLRANHRKDDVFLYPLKLDRTQVSALLTDMLLRANALHDRPEFYNTAFNTCTTNAADHLNAVSPGILPWDSSFILPGYSDAYFLERGLIDTDLPADQIRGHFKINERAAACADDPDFSACIRVFPARP